MKTACLALLGFLVCQACVAEEPPPPPEPYRPDSATPAPITMRDVPLADVLKDLVAKNLPHDIAFDKNDSWGHQAHVPTLHGVQVVEVLRNHGNWQKMKAVCQDLPHAIRVRVSDLHYSADSASCTVHVHLPATLEYEHKTWQNGIQVQGSHGRARFRFQAMVVLAAKIHFDGKGELVADEVREVRVVSTKVHCDEFVCENVNGVGGDAAKIIGGKVEHAFHDWQLALEQNMQAKVCSAILQAGQTPQAAAAMARAINSISAQARNAALHPAFSTATVEPLPQPQAVPAVLQPEPTNCPEFSLFIELQLNGGSERAGASGRAAMAARSSHIGSPFHLEHVFGSLNHGEHLSVSSHAGDVHKLLLGAGELARVLILVGHGLVSSMDHPHSK